VSRRNFWRLIDQLSQGGATIFVTTHYMDEADYCDRLALIYRGRIIAEGTPSQLRHEYMTRHVLEVETDRVVEAMDILSKNGIDAAIFGAALHITVEKAEEDRERIVGLLERAGMAVKRCEKIVPSLEDVFVTLIEVA
jgi:ABC-2 type transport system ATP-binding protein